MQALLTARAWWTKALPLVLLAAGLVETPLLDPSHAGAGAAALYTAVASATALRHRFPIVAAAGVVAANLASGALGGVKGSITLWLAFTVVFYGLGLRVPGERRPVAIALVIATSAAYIPAADGRLENFLAAAAVSILMPYLAGLLRQRQLHARQLHQAAERRERELQEALRNAADDERQRLARELHDIVSHTVGTIAVQAEAGDALMDRDPAAARASVRAIQQQARSAMVELRRLLALLRSDDPEALRSPLPGLAQLGGLVERMRSAGLEVEVTVAGEPCDLPVAIDLSAYRIIQEGVTNALVHSGASEVAVSIAFLDHSLEVEIRDHGRGMPAPFGTGLTGMRERVTLLGGELEAGPTAPGWRLAVRLPIAAELRA